MWVDFVWFLDEFGSASAPFRWGVDEFGHDLECMEDKFVCRFKEVFEDFIRYGVLYGGLADICLVARGGVMASLVR